MLLSIISDMSLQAEGPASSRRDVHKLAIKFDIPATARLTFGTAREFKRSDTSSSAFEPAELKSCALSRFHSGTQLCVAAGTMRATCEGVRWFVTLVISWSGVTRQSSESIKLNMKRPTPQADAAT